MPVKLEFLWDEVKTRKLFKTHLILFLIGSIVALIYSLLISSTNDHPLVILSIPPIITICCIVNILQLSKPYPGIRFLIFTLATQLAVSIYMAVTGGFLGIVEFAPYMFLLFTVFELGAASTLILGGFSVLTFTGILFWQLANHSGTNVIPTFIYYVGSYLLIVFIENNIGKEISVQFEARKLLEEIDDLKNQFITLSSHYLRTPLTVIKGSIANLSATMVSDNQITNLKHIKSSVFNLESLIEKMLIIATIEKGQIKAAFIPSDIIHFLNDLVNEFQPVAKDHQIKLLFQTPNTDLIQTSFDPIKLKEAIGSIIDNAIKYNKAGGSVEVNLTRTDQLVIIEISDTGSGIDNDHLAHLFTPFNKGNLSQALNMNNPGMGLGLYLAKLIVEAHGGRIEVESEVNHGSTFRILLPLICTIDKGDS